MKRKLCRLFSSIEVHERPFWYLLTASLLIILAHFVWHPVRVLGMDISIFYMDEKYTLAAFLTSVTAFLTGYIWLSTQAKRWQQGLKRWVDLAVGWFFIALSLDEYFEIHEYVNGLIKNAVSDELLVGSLAQQSWIFPLSVAVLAVLITFYLRYRHEVSLAVKKPFGLGLICFGMIIVLELAGGKAYGMHPHYLWLVGMEEGLEMVSLSLFLKAGVNRGKIEERRKN